MNMKKHSLTTSQIWFRVIAAFFSFGVLLWGLSLLEPDGKTELWIKAAHIIAVICWMAGMLYLPRLFIYHCTAEKGSKQSETFKVMEARLLRYIINPAMVIAWGTGLWMAWKIYEFHGGWLHLKLAAVVVFSAFHGFLSSATRRFAEDRNKISQKVWRILNEMPTLLMIVIVIAVVVKLPV